MSIASFPSRRRLPGQPPPGVTTVFDFLCYRFPKVPAGVWAGRFDRGLVLHEGKPLSINALFVPDLEVQYFREIPGLEPAVRSEIAIIHQDEDLLIVDKPHFLPVVPTGPYVRSCLLTMLRERTDLSELVPLHRIDRDTAGLVAFSTRAATRTAMAAPFRTGVIEKQYRAICRVRGDLPPRILDIEGHIAVDVPFWRRRLVSGAPSNSFTRARLIAARAGLGYFRIEPRTGRTHQIRVHMASIGCPLLNDRVYAEGLFPGAGEVSAPLQLLARRLDLAHPITHKLLRLKSQRRLSALVLF